MTLAERILLMVLKAHNFASEPREPTEAQRVQGLKGGKFEMNRSQCPVAKILMYKIVHGFLPTGFH
jgi:hypothetical protein